jgi:hypothetical protein
MQQAPFLMGALVLTLVVEAAAADIMEAVEDT